MGTSSQVKCTTKYFPFSSGIPWQIKNGRYVQPEVSAAILQSKLRDKDIVVAAFGGLLESFYSLSILEAINYMMPGHSLFWCCTENRFVLFGVGVCVGRGFPSSILQASRELSRRGLDILLVFVLSCLFLRAFLVQRPGLLQLQDPYFHREKCC